MKKFCKRLFVVLLIELHIFAGIANALVMPSLSTPVGREIAAAMAARGAAPALGRVMSGLGVYGLIAGLLLPPIIDWALSPDKDKVTYTPPGSGSGATGTKFRGATYNGLQVAGGSAVGVGTSIIFYGECQQYSGCSQSGISYGAAYVASSTPAGSYPRNHTVAMLISWNGGSVTRTAIVSEFDTDAPTTPAYTVPAAAPQPKTVPVADAIPDLPAEAKEKPISAAQMADLINKILDDDRAANGAKPYNDTASNPVTETQIEKLRQQTGETPKVGDLAAPTGFPAPEAIKNPYENTPVQNPSAPITPSGIDWTIPSSTETIQKQSVPVTYTPTIFQSATGCPAPIEFAMFGKSYYISWQPACDLMVTVSPIFLATGAAAAALIFARSLKS